MTQAGLLRKTSASNGGNFNLVRTGVSNCPTQGSLLLTKFVVRLREPARRVNVRRDVVLRLVIFTWETRQYGSFCLWFA